MDLGREGEEVWRSHREPPSSDQEPRWEVGRQGSALSCLRPTQRPESQTWLWVQPDFSLCTQRFTCQHHAKHLLLLHEDYLKKKLNFLLWKNFQAYIKVQSSFHEPIIRFNHHQTSQSMCPLPMTPPLLLPLIECIPSLSHFIQGQPFISTAFLGIWGRKTTDEAIGSSLLVQRNRRPRSEGKCSRLPRWEGGGWGPGLGPRPRAPLPKPLHLPGLAPSSVHRP